MTAYSHELETFAAYDAQVMGVSVDSTWSHIAWQEKEIGKLRYPLASDFYPHGEVARKYGVLRQGPPIPGINERCVFIVDKGGHIAFSQVYPLDQTPEIPELLEVLRQLQESAA